MEQQFNLKDEYIELHKLLKITNLCSSGGEAKAVISDSQVIVDGQIELRKRCKIRTGQVVVYNQDTITVE
jgi:ribosome-associated protein